MYCKNCGKEIGDAAFCSSCGVASKTDASQDTPTGYIPSEVKGWNWGAFLFTIIWGIGNKTYLSLLCLIPFVGFFWRFFCGAYGNEWAFKAGNYSPSDLRKCLTIQKTWNRAGLIAFIAILSIILLYILAIILFLSLIF